MPRTSLPLASALAALALVLGPVPLAHADDPATPAPDATTTPAAPTEVDPKDPDLELPEGAKLAPSKVLDIVSVTDQSTNSADEGEERYEESNSQITYALQSEVLFGKNSAKLNSDAAARINAIAADIKSMDVTSTIRVFGFTDNLGSYEHGEKLSKDRANAVYKVLTKTLTSGNTFQVRGYSEDYPIADNSTEAGRKQNRRVEITFTPPSS